MPELFDPAETALLLDCAAEYLVGTPNVNRKAPTPKGPPTSLHADEHLQYYFDKLPGIFARLFAADRYAPELTRLRHTLDHLFTVELEIINRAESVAFHDAIFHPMLWFRFDVTRYGRAQMRLGFRAADAPEGIFIEVEGREHQAIIPHRLPAWWKPAGYAAIAASFQRDLLRLANTELSEEEMILDAQRLSFTNTAPGLEGIAEAIATHGSNAYAFLRLLMKEGAAQINASVFEQMREGGAEPFDDQEIGEWQDVAGGYLRYWADRETDDHHA